MSEYRKLLGPESDALYEEWLEKLGVTEDAEGTVEQRRVGDHPVRSQAFSERPREDA